MIFHSAQALPYFLSWTLRCCITQRVLSRTFISSLNNSDFERRFVRNHEISNRKWNIPISAAAVFRRQFCLFHFWNLFYRTLRAVSMLQFWIMPKKNSGSFRGKSRRVASKLVGLATSYLYVHPASRITEPQPVKATVFIEMNLMIIQTQDALFKLSFFQGFRSRHSFHNTLDWGVNGSLLAFVNSFTSSYRYFCCSSISLAPILTLTSLGFF